MANELKKAESFVIDTKKMIRGQLCQDGEYCALGFYLKSCGVPSKDLNTVYPGSMDPKYGDFLENIGFLRYEDSTNGCRISDNTDLTKLIANTSDKRRPYWKIKLRRIFKEKLNVELTFE